MPIFVEEDVVGFNVPVDYAYFVQAMNGKNLEGICMRRMKG